MGPCWLYVSSGLYAHAQDELVFLLGVDATLDQRQIPRQLIYHILSVYDKARHGHGRIGSMNCSLYDFHAARSAEAKLNANNNNNNKSSNGDSQQQQQQLLLLDNKDNVGFLYFAPNEYHGRAVLQHVAAYLPDSPFLVGLLVQRPELVWAKLLPLRLYLRLGELAKCEFDLFLLLLHFELEKIKKLLLLLSKVYPSPVMIDRHRKPAYGDELGHTIMSLLSDTRNFQYTIPQIEGLYIHVDGEHTADHAGGLGNASTIRISIPESQYDSIGTRNNK